MIHIKSLEYGLHKAKFSKTGISESPIRQHAHERREKLEIFWASAISWKESGYHDIGRILRNRAIGRIKSLTRQNTVDRIWSSRVLRLNTIAKIGKRIDKLGKCLVFVVVLGISDWSESWRNGNGSHVERTGFGSGHAVEHILYAARPVYRARSGEIYLEIS